MLLSPILQSIKEDPEASCLFRLDKDEWTIFSRQDVLDAAFRLCGQWKRDGLKSGDRILLLMENRPEWAVTAIASGLYGLVLVPAYTTHLPHEIEYLLNRSEAAAVMTSDGKLRARIETLSISASLHLYFATNDEPSLFSNIVGGPYQLRSEDLFENDRLYALIATSGTNGLPKLVELTHQNLMSNVTGILTILREAHIDQPHRFLSFLPLAHAYEHMAGLYLPLHLRGEIFYCERLDKLPNLMAEVKPTLMTAVPRLYELLYSRITAQVAKGGAFKQWLFETTLRLGNTPQLKPLDRMLNTICERLVREKVRQRFGGRLQYFVSGGAALNPEISRFFAGLGIGILQGYGQTEASPVISVNRPGSARAETVGPALPDVQVKLSEEGELLVRGPNVMRGYWRDQEASSQVLHDGWLHTGDLADIDPDGHIRIVGRLKDLIVNSGGDNIAPAPIEQEITLYPEVDQVVVVGDAKPWLSVLICLNSEFEKQDPQALVYEILKRYNRHKPSLVQLRKAIVMNEPCSIDNGLLTPTQKIKRPKLIALYREAIDALYGPMASSK